MASSITSFLPRSRQFNPLQDEISLLDATPRRGNDRPSPPGENAQNQRSQISSEKEPKEGGESLGFMAAGGGV